MRTIIAGSRDITDYGVILCAVTDSGFKITEVVCGEAKGVDALGKAWARNNGIHVASFPAAWHELGKSAGPVRNAEMAEYAEALICVHHGTPGSLHMVKLARAKGLKVYEKVIDCAPHS